MATLTQLPDLALSLITDFLKIEGPYRDKTDIVRDAMSLKLAGCHHMAQDLINYVDPFNINGKCCAQVKKNIVRQKNKLVHSETAKKVWGLTDDDLEKIPSKRKRRNNKTVVLYLRQAIRSYSAAKFAHNVYNMERYCVQEKRNRLESLQAALQKHNATFRLESKLCERFVETGKGDMFQIAETLKEIEFCYTYTDYCSYYEYYSIVNYMDFGYFDWAFISDLAKNRALEEFHKKFPNVNKNLMHK